jgi:hypothetical protein
MTDEDRARPTLAELASRGTKRVSIQGKPADVCPYCGCAMFANGTNTLTTRIERYVVCRNGNCKTPDGKQRRFLSYQPPATIVREVGTDDDFSCSGIAQLTVHRESA